MNILVTGGAGYIGSVMTRQLVDAGHAVVVIDNFSNGHRDAVDTRAILEVFDLSDNSAVLATFKKYSFDAVIHFAGAISVFESMKNPDKYFRENTVHTLNILEAMKHTGVKKMIFSSTAAVYGNPTKIPIPESHPKHPTNPYGESKLMVERILRWFDSIYAIRSISLRYFNASGASLDGKLGERHKDETHIVPRAMMALIHNASFTIHGSDYQTKDGTCIRDYIHVEDLCAAHFSALNALNSGMSTNTYNVATGKGYSNREVLTEVERVSHKKLTITEGDRRDGDPEQLIADPTRIVKELQWKPKHSDLTTIIESAWQYFVKDL